MNSLVMVFCENCKFAEANILFNGMAKLTGRCVHKANIQNVTTPMKIKTVYSKCSEVNASNSCPYFIQTKVIIKNGRLVDI